MIQALNTLHVAYSTLCQTIIRFLHRDTLGLNLNQSVDPMLFNL